MDNNNSAQNNSSFSPPTLSPATPKLEAPILPASSQSQLFIHPEHEAGTLTVKQEKSGNLTVRFDHKFLIFFSFILVFGSVAALLFFFLLPRSQTVKFANSTKEVVSSSSEKTEEIDKSLEILYKARTSQTDDVTLSGISVQGTQLTNSSNTMVKPDFFANILDLAKKSNETLESKEKVRGFSVPAYDPNKESRKHRELAKDISEKSEAAQEVNIKLIQLKSTTTPTSANELKTELEKLQENSKEYIDQADSTAEYYISLSDSAIELTNLASSLNTTKDIDNAISKLSSLKTKFSEEENLPSGIEEYNKDIVETFDLLIGFFQQIRNGSIVTQDQALKAYNNFIVQVQSVSQRALTHEIDFWQNNDALTGWENLLDEHTNVLKKAEKVKNSNDFILLQWAGAT